MGRLAASLRCLCLDNRSPVCGFPTWGAGRGRAEQELGDGPLILIDEGGRVLAADARAAARGVVPGMGERQAVVRCPEARSAPAARYPIWEAQDALLEQVKRYAWRWQPAGLGCIYLETEERQASPPRRAAGPSGLLGRSPLPTHLLDWCQALAGAVRQLGWEPALGVTGSKFGADVAGQVAGVELGASGGAGGPAGFSGRTADSHPAVGCRGAAQPATPGHPALGQFARLPAAAVSARFGLAGRTAERWALGLDDRPVVPPWEARETSARIELDGPSADRERLLALLGQRAERLLSPLQESLQEAGRVTLLVTRADGRTVPASYTFPQPTAAAGAVRLGLAAALDRITWDGQPAVEIALTLAGIQDAPGRQLALFDLAQAAAGGNSPQGRARLEAALRRLAAGFGPDAFRLATLVNPDNPLPERRVSWREA